jgi:prepilin-type processing-associated H-X9-DG protein
MPVPFACPHCGEQTLVDEQFAGQSGPCIGCGKLIVVPYFYSAGTLHPNSPAASRSPRTKVLWIIGGSVAAFAGLSLVLWLLAGPLFDAIQTQKNRRTCSANLRKIGQALVRYEQQHGSLPPAVVTDSAGKPLYSWRVLILPYLGPQEQALYRQFRLDEPWNSPANSRLLKQMPSVFHCPGDVSAAADETSYVVIAGPSTPFAPRQSLGIGQIRDGAYATILVVETANTKIAWSEPRDLSDTQLSYQIGVDIGGNHAGGMNALFADGNVRFLPDTLSTEEVTELVTASGGEGDRLKGYGY